MKNLLKTIGITITLFYAPRVLSGDKPWYMGDIKKMNSANYTQNCRKIGTIQEVRTLGLIAYSLVTHDKRHPEKQLQEIEQQLQRFASKLYAKEERALLAIKNKFNIGNDEWNGLMNSIISIKQINKQAMTQAWPNTIHSPHLPETLKNELYQLLQQNKIHPNSINITIASQQKDYTMAEAASEVKFFSNPILQFEAIYEPQEITIYPKMLDLCDIEQKANLAHEVEHLIQQHTTTILIIEVYLQHNRHLSPEEIHNCGELKELKKIHEQQAEILSSIKDPLVAQCMTLLRANAYYPDTLYEKHYYHLSTIHMLWQLHAWVKFFHHGGIERSIEEFKEKIEMRMAAFKNYCTQYLHA